MIRIVFWESKLLCIHFFFFFLFFFSIFQTPRRFDQFWFVQVNVEITYMIFDRQSWFIQTVYHTWKCCLSYDVFKHCGYYLVLSRVVTYTLTVL